MKLDQITEQYPHLKKVVDKVKEIDRVETLYPPQAEALQSGLLNGKNLVLSIPTASGKTLVSEFAMLNSFLKTKKKAIYLVPLVALASEKYEDLKEKYSEFAKIGISTGDFDSTGSGLENFDIIILTVEKMDALMRNQAEWIKDIGIVVLDEVHLIDSPRRGPTLEIVTTQLKQLGVQFLALSATIENSEELAKWLDAELVESEFRPVKLFRGIYNDFEISFDQKDPIKFEFSPDEAAPLLALDTVKSGAQSLVFVNTRRGAEKEAERTGLVVYPSLNTKEKKELMKVAEKIMGVLDSPTRQCKRLAGCVKKGTAFHHAGLHNKQRTLIEKAYKQNVIKVVSATPTLAAGVNLPGKRVIIRDYKRYGSYGLEPIPVLEIHQMFGRAGRPKYDKEGEAVLLAKTLPEFEMLWEQYIEGRPEPVSSKLGVEPILRMHTLGLISQNAMTRQDILDFYSQTFYALQFKNIDRIEEILENILNQLFGWEFIDYDANDRFKCTPLGLRIAQLYIDPLTANEFIELLAEKVPDDMVLLTILSNAAEMRPLQAVRQSEELELYEQFTKYDFEEEHFRAFKNAIILLEWMNEVTDDKLLDKYNIAPGTLRTKINIADWLLYACSEIARLKDRKKIIPKVNALRKQLKYGVKAELLPLIRIPNIGRVRARKLFNAEVQNIEDIKELDPDKLVKLIGVKTAEKVTEHLGLYFEKPKIGLEKYFND